MFKTTQSVYVEYTSVTNRDFYFENEEQGNNYARVVNRREATLVSSFVYIFTITASYILNNFCKPYLKYDVGVVALIYV